MVQFIPSLTCTCIYTCTCTDSAPPHLAHVHVTSTIYMYSTVYNQQSMRVKTGLWLSRAPDLIQHIREMCVVALCTGYAVAQWLGLYLQLLGVAMVAGVSFLAVLEHHFSSVDPGSTHVTLVIHVQYTYIVTDSKYL